MRRYSEPAAVAAAAAKLEFVEATPYLVSGGGFHSSTFPLNLSRFGHTSPCPPV